MTIYSVDKLMSEARRIAADYRRATGKSLAISGEIAKNDACKYLDLKPAESQSEGYDAIGLGSREGLKIQIKGRAIFDHKKSGQRIGQLKVDQQWDLIVLVLMDEEFEAYEIYEVNRVEIIDNINNAAQSNRSKRGAMSISRFKNISQLVWTREEGIVDDTLWDNQTSS